ncbi:NADPH-dependent 7-cyano-7-deazaguanine reductase QueF [Marinobacterium sp. AK62]|uniref:NADPH-dependent 7-cyano-7-deazaguanine reductase n=1 Tax=Marinobacterium alkalitolerans TaxID=1542925 RepID=A0ABS3ZCB5_9GAMM|nr:NADPH-dependent 7-cyano-7-deazaguanine reductase QueF [Marinobacterium alkalitolerans]MBP0048960.1 NADPH-dependent 7-cyano-7-deazaguanine reductase QueF [Marinobacterium alkalitolerans]
MSEHEQVKASPLGQETAYVNEYDPSLLYPIARDLNWEAKGVKRATLPFRGVDIWNAYEVSWLDRGGKPVVRLAEFRIPANSPNIIESKSFKLYLNSYNLSRFESEADVVASMQRDLSAAAGAQVDVRLSSMSEPVEVCQLKGLCLDELPLNVEHYTPAPELLSATGPVADETLVSHLLKSNCPVTGQPDWASIQIRYKGPKIDHTGLLAYLISYREHGDFHEQCVENIFMDIWQRCRPQKLSVYARYVRRGGLDINPYRSSMNDAPVNVRLARQ